MKKALVLTAIVALVTGAAVEAVTLNPGDILVADDDAFGGGGGILRVDPLDGTQTPIASGGFFVDPTGIALSPDGDILILQSRGLSGECFGFNGKYFRRVDDCGGVIRVSPATGEQTVVASRGSFIDPRGIAVAANGDIFVADEHAFGGEGGVIRVNPATGEQFPVVLGESPRGIALEADGKLLLVNAGSVTRVKPGTGLPAATVRLSVGGGNGIAVSRTGEIFISREIVHRSTITGAVVHVEGAVVHVDPFTGDQATVVSGLAGGVRGIAVDAENQVLVALRDGKAVVRIDPTTKMMSTVSSGANFAGPYGLAVVPVPEPSPVQGEAEPLLVQCEADLTAVQSQLSSANAQIQGLTSQLAAHVKATIANGGVTLLLRPPAPGMVTMQATADPRATLRLSIDNVAVKTCAESLCSHVWNAEAGSTSSPTVKARAFDATNRILGEAWVRGLHSAFVSVAVPSVASGVVTIVATADPATSVDIRLDGILLKNCRGTACSHAWDTRTAANGTHVISVKAHPHDGTREMVAYVKTTVVNGTTGQSGTSSTGSNTSSTTGSGSTSGAGGGLPVGDPVYAVSDLPRPELLHPMVDPVFGTTITRVTDPLMRSERGYHHECARLAALSADTTKAVVIRMSNGLTRCSSSGGHAVLERLRELLLHATDGPFFGPVG